MGDERGLPIIYIRGYAGPTAGIDSQVDDPFYGFNHGATHVRVGGSAPAAHPDSPGDDGDPLYYQFEGPMLRLMIDEQYQLLVHGDQHQYLLDAEPDSVAWRSLWVYRFYDQAATTFVPPPHENVMTKVFRGLHQKVTADGFDLEVAAEGLYDLIQLVRAKTGAPKVFLVAHSMGGLIARCTMQKICLQDGRERAASIVDKLFTYGTPHGGIAFELGALNWAESAFGPAGSDIFAPEKMYGYLTEGKKFGDVPGAGERWDPQEMPDTVFPVDDIFCIVGTDPKDYGLSRVVVGPKSDGLVLIEHAYVRRAHRAYVYKSHSGSYGEVNSEEGYQNLRRFLFARWKVGVALSGLPAAAPGPGSDDKRVVWQADMRLAVRGLPIVLSEQQAAHWCPIQLDTEIAKAAGGPVPLLGTFLFAPEELTGTDRDGNPVPPPHGGLARYALTLRVYKLVQQRRGFLFADHLEQVADWADTLIVDVGPRPDGSGLQAYLAWNSEVDGAVDEHETIVDEPAQVSHDGGGFVLTAPLPATAQGIPVLGAQAALRIEVSDRAAARTS